MAMPGRRETVTFRDAHLLFKNFAGEEKTYNKKGDRNFSIMLNEQDALALMENGWNVKKLKLQEDEEQAYHLKVSVNFENRPPRCWLISSGGRTMLAESMVALMDQVESTRIDLVISAYDWAVNGNSGRKAYLQSIFFTMYEDELELEYAEIPQMASVGDQAPKQIESGARQSYDYDGEVTH